MNEGEPRFSGPEDTDDADESEGSPEDQESGIEEEGGSEEEPEGDPEQAALASIEAGLERIERYRETAEALEKQALETSEAIDAIRTRIGLPKADVPNETRRSADDAERRFEEQMEELDAMEEAFLAVPDGEEVDKGIDEHMVDLARLDMELASEKAQVETKAFRADLATANVERGNTWAGKEAFGSMLDDKENSDKARQLLVRKALLGRGIGSLRYIESGKSSDFAATGLRAKIEWKTIKDPGGWSAKEYITKVDVSVGDLGSAGKSDKGLTDVELLGSEDKSEIARGEQEGTVEKGSSS